jgi:hypothetical protein
MLVHAATAPNAVLAALPSLPIALWPAGFDAAWTATAAVVSAYRPSSAGVVVPAQHEDTEALFATAVAHGGEHVVKLADAAADGYARTGDRTALAAVETAVRLGA